MYSVDFLAFSNFESKDLGPRSLGPWFSRISILKPARTPFLDESKVENSSSDNKEGLLAPIACKVLMKILYGARLARFDLLRPIAALASKITKWDSVCAVIEGYID